MHPKLDSDVGAVHRPLSVGAAALAFVLLVAGASLASLGRSKLQDAAEDGTTQLARTKLREGAVREAEHRARIASEIVDQTVAASRALAAHVARLGRAPVDGGRTPFEFSVAASQQLPWFVSAPDDISVLAPDPSASDADLAALAWRGKALTAVAQTVRSQIPEHTRFSIWVRDEGVVLHPSISATDATRWLGPHAGFGASLLSPAEPAEAGWLPENVGPEGRRTLPYTVPLLDDEGRPWAIVRCDIDFDELLVSVVVDTPDGSDMQPLLLDQSGDVIAAAPGAGLALGLPREHASDLERVRERLVALVGDTAFVTPSNQSRSNSVNDTVFGTAPVAGVNWTLGVVVPRSAARHAAATAAVGTSRAARDLALAIVGFCGLFGILITATGFGLAQMLRRRLAGIVTAARAHADGRLMSRAPVGGNDEFDAIGLAMNATALRMQENLRRLDESRRRLSGLIGNMTEGLVITDADDRVTFANARFAEILRRPGSALVGHFLEEFLVPQSLDIHREELAERREGANTRFEVTWRNVGATHPQTLVAAMPLFDADGRYTGSCGVVTDVTRQAHLQAESARADKLRALGEMAGGVAHDFNNVLTAVLGNTQYLLQEDLSDEMRETLRIIETAALDGTQTVNRIRKFTKPSAGVQHAGPVDANAAAHDILRMARPRFERVAHERGVEYEVVMQREAQRDIRGNAAEIREVLLNLAFNALEAMPNGGTLTIETFDRGEDAVGIRIADTGQGIPDEHLNKIFDPFFSTKRGGRCSGLGLSICFGIVRAHGGRIDVRSEPGIGTTFTVVLPAFIEISSDSATQEAQSPPPEPRVLLVSGRRREALAMQRGLNVRSIHAALVDSVSVAQDLLGDEGIFNTLVVEYDVAGQSGWELARAARRARPDLRIIVLTETQRPVDDTQARNAGIDRVLARPFDTEDVEGIILRALAIPPAQLPNENNSEPESGAPTFGMRRIPLIRELWGELIDSAATRVDPVAHST